MRRKKATFARYMILHNISITSYKNLRQVRLAFSPRVNCLVGHNGEGKTNLLDAIYMLSFCHSSNNPLDSELITHGEDFFSLDGRYTRDDGTPETIHCHMQRGQRKIVRRNEKAYKRLSEHIGLIPLILVTPQDTLLVEAAGEQRRRFIDRVISQYDHSYLEVLAAYNKALAQRNALLRQETAPDVALMEVYETAMATTGEQVYSKREAFLREFAPYVQAVYAQIANGKETVTVGYTSHCQRGALLDIIQQGRAKDRIMGYSLHGIHRDDLSLQLNGYAIRHEGSQGQMKTLVLAMKLAQAVFLQRTVSLSTPLLLLDDIFDKLDAQRVEAIMALVSSEQYGQIFITDTNRDHIDTILSSSQMDYSLFYVERGNITALHDVNNQ